jgi:hypothetical protein
MYFKSVETEEIFPNFATAGRTHAEALNQYLIKPDGGEREVEHMNTMQYVIDVKGVIYTTTFLCCEGDEYE